MRRRSLPLLLLALVLLPLGIGVALADRDHRRSSLDQDLVSEASEQASTISAQFARGRSISLLISNNPALRQYYEQLGPQAPTVATRRALVEGRVVKETEGALSYLSELFPDSIAEVCFLDRGGVELARSVYGVPLPAPKLLPDKSDRPFFKPAFSLARGQVYQAKPFVSKDTKDWVVPTATEVRTAGSRERAIVHFDLQIESFRRAMADTAGGFGAYVVDGRGAVIIDSAKAQAKAGVLGNPTDRRFVSIASEPARSGVVDAGEVRAAYSRVARPSAANANHWFVVVTAPQPGVGGFSPVTIGLVGVVVLLALAAVVNLRRRQAELDDAAHTDALTSLPNRRQLLADLDECSVTATEARPVVLALFDLDGFKAYNDTYGHSAGDALLERLGVRLAEAMPAAARAYRLGGDEFCVVAQVPTRCSLDVVEAASTALTEHGKGFKIGASHGAVLLPGDAADAAAALVLADRRMYAHKNSSRASAGRQTRDVLLSSLREIEPDLHDHVEDVGRIAVLVGRELGLEGADLDVLQRAAELHDVGKIAIPESILKKPAALDESEWAFMRRHTIIGERILNAAPSLASAAPLVRSAHERWDGKGYPDGLRGADIPLGARIIFACDAYHAMTSDRPYKAGMSHEEALSELQRCAGTQFDPAVIAALVAAASNVHAPADKA